MLKRLGLIVILLLLTAPVLAEEGKKQISQKELDAIWNETTKATPGEYIVVTGQPSYNTFLVNTATGDTWRVILDKNGLPSGWGKMNSY